MCCLSAVPGQKFQVCAQRSVTYRPSDILGTPSLDDFYAITSQRSREYIRALPFRKKKPFSTLFPTANPLVSTARRHGAARADGGGQAIDLMEKCLTFSPKRRIDVNEALQHPYLAVRWSR